MPSASIHPPAWTAPIWHWPTEISPSRHHQGGGWAGTRVYLGVVNISQRQVQSISMVSKITNKHHSWAIDLFGMALSSNQMQCSGAFYSKIPTFCDENGKTDNSTAMHTLRGINVFRHNRNSISWINFQFSAQNFERKGDDEEGCAPVACGCIRSGFVSNCRMYFLKLQNVFVLNEKWWGGLCTCRMRLRQKRDWWEPWRCDHQRPATGVH